MAPFKNRVDAGNKLAQALEEYRGTDAVVYALPRGGVPVGRPVADALGVPLDLVISRKIGHPNNPEYAVCAVAEDGEMLCDKAERRALDCAWLADAVERERAEALRQSAVYRAGRRGVSPEGKTAIIVDDGIATGLTIHAAIRALRAKRPSRVVVATPCAPQSVAESLRREADRVVVLEGKERYRGAVGAYYDAFPQTSDEEVRRLLQKT